MFKDTGLRSEWLQSGKRAGLCCEGIVLRLDGIGEQMHCREVGVLVFLFQCGHIIVPTVGDSVKETWHLRYFCNSLCNNYWKIKGFLEKKNTG